jgi:hypothetical protein
MSYSGMLLTTQFSFTIVNALLSICLISQGKQNMQI